MTKRPQLRHLSQIRAQPYAVTLRRRGQNGGNTRGWRLRTGDSIGHVSVLRSGGASWRRRREGTGRMRGHGSRSEQAHRPCFLAGPAVKLGLLPLNVGQAQEDGQPMTFPRVLARHMCGAVNTMTLHFAGHAAFADLEHAGRKSGRVRHTPVRAFRAGDTVVVGLNFGRRSDWYQNIKAAGTCRMRLGGEQLTLGAPTLVPVEQGVEGMPRLFGFALRHVVHTAECVQLPILQTSRTWVTRR